MLSTTPAAMLSSSELAITTCLPLSDPSPTTLIAATSPTTTVRTYFSDLDCFLKFLVFGVLRLYHFSGWLLPCNSTTRIPRLLSAEGFSEWMFRFEKYVKMKDVKVWRSFLREPVKIAVTREDGTVVDKPVENYTYEELDKVDQEEKALAILTMALSPNIAQGFREYKSVKSLWEALIEVYEGNDDMKQSIQDLLCQRLNMFNHVLGEMLEIQLQRFITLNTKMSTAGIVFSKIKVNKKLLNSLPRSWDMNVAVIKKTRDLSKLSLSEVMAIIKFCDMDDKQREINHVNSFQSANLGTATNSEFSALPAQHVSSSSSLPMAPPASSTPSPVTKSTSPAPVFAKGAEENMTLMAGFMNYYNAFFAGELVQPVMIGDLDQIHPKDIEEMDIYWQIAMAVFRAKKFTQRTRRNNWGANVEKKVGFNKSKLRCYNCQEPGHFARAHLAQIEADKDVDLAEETMMELQFAFMVSTTPVNNEKSKPLLETLDAKTSDFKKLQDDYNIKCCHHKFAKEKIASLTAELDVLKAKYNDVDFNIKKFDASSTVVESMIEHELKWQIKHGEGFGYKNVPPPFNDNYTLSIENQEIEQPTVSSSV
ncbi:hypothetical protein L2E82_35434 [Cichorium intybus]|uniref:Uncharacterized protein n=1 Tax=Cichorium intybus TaxID=13427 RepID=A0ACB9BNT9_CICIN|nr:hypothetical protein L2E82_35434 [Cichorium intybus]